MKAQYYVPFVLLLAGLTAGCQKKPTENSVSSSARQLVVGGILSKSGGAAAYGGDADKGARLAVDEINAADRGVRVTFISQDDMSDQGEAARVARTLIDVNKVNVILGPAISPSALSVGKLAEERQIPIVATSATLDSVTASNEYDRKYVFRVCYSDRYEGLALAQFAWGSLHLHKAAIVFDQTLVYSTEMARTFKEQFTKLGGVIVQEEHYSVSDTDYSALVDRINKSDAEFLFIPGWDENVGPMLRQARGKWDKFTLLGGDGWPTTKLLELAGGYMPTSYAASHLMPGKGNAHTEDFRKAYREKYANEEPSPFAALGYDAMQLITDAARRARTLSGPDLREALAATHGLELSTGTLVFDPQRNPLKDIIIVRIYSDRIAFHKVIKVQ